MRVPIYTDDPWQENYSEIIDVRSPVEFAEDRVPGAINLPVLSNEERIKVGTIYKQVSPFNARKLGSAFVAKNISESILSHFSDKEREYSPLIYCWRGGQRSNSLAIVLSQIGWQVTVLEGGYKTYRAHVREQLKFLPQQFTYKVLCGLTGTGKTHILHQLARKGMQVLNLEALANHRGSLLGQEWDNRLEPQPSQKLFESRLLQKLKTFKSNKIVWLESESNKIGQIYLPSILWQKMKASTCIEIQLPIEERVNWLIEKYAHFIEEPELLKSKLAKLKYRYGGDTIASWFRLIDGNRWPELVKELLTVHYDPAYRRSMSQTFQPVESAIELASLSDRDVSQALGKFC